MVEVERERVGAKAAELSGGKGEPSTHIAVYLIRASFLLRYWRRCCLFPGNGRSGLREEIY